MENHPDNIYFRSDIELADVFEPNQIQAAFTEKPLNLGSLIFGERKAGELGVPQSSVADPLTAMFAKGRSPYIHFQLSNFIEFGGIDLQLCQPTHLNNDCYTELFTLGKAVGQQTCWRATNTYRIENGKQIWSITRNFPPNVQHCEGTR